MRYGKLQVIEEDISKGKPKRANACAISQSILRLDGVKNVVTIPFSDHRIHSEILFHNGQEKIIAFTEEAYHFAINFDQGKEVKPILLEYKEVTLEN